MPPSLPASVKLKRIFSFVPCNWPTSKFPAKDQEEGKNKNKKRNKSHDPLLIVRVLSYALAPGDVRVLSGKTDYIQLPSSGHPYVVGSNISGIVVALEESDEASGRHGDNHKFAIGGYVILRFDEPQPNRGVAEYRLVKSLLTEKCPPKISLIHACGLPASAMAAKRIVLGHVRPQGRDNMRVIGGSGAIGSSVIQYAKLHGGPKTTVVAVSTQKELCLKLGADRVVDYRSDNWWEVPDFCSSKGKFDVVFDMVNRGKNWETGACKGNAI